MRDVMLIVHFLGLAMGVGTAFAFFFLSKVRAKMEKQEAEQFFLKTLFLGNMAKIGISFLVLSGGYLMTPFWSEFRNMPFLMAKLSLVIILIALLLTQIKFSKIAKKNNGGEALLKIGKIGKISMLIGIWITVLAVKTFH